MDFGFLLVPWPPCGFWKSNGRNEQTAHEMGISVIPFVLPSSYRVWGMMCKKSPVIPIALHYIFDLNILENNYPTLFIRNQQ